MPDIYTDGFHFNAIAYEYADTFLASLIDSCSEYTYAGQYIQMAFISMLFSMMVCDNELLNSLLRQEAQHQHLLPLSSAELHHNRLSCCTSALHYSMRSIEVQTLGYTELLSTCS